MGKVQQIEKQKDKVLVANERVKRLKVSTLRSRLVAHTKTKTKEEGNENRTESGKSVQAKQNKRGENNSERAHSTRRVREQGTKEKPERGENKEIERKKYGITHHYLNRF